MNISGAILRKHLNDQVGSWIENCLKRDLVQLDALHTFNTLHEVIRAIEEFINVSFHGVSDEDFNTLRVMPILNWNPYYNNLIERIVKKRFDKDVADRYKRVAQDSHMMLREFLITGDNLGYSTLMETAALYQAYRRHFISILLIVPSYCKGKQKLSEADLLRIAVHISKFCIVNLTSLHRQIVLSYVYKNYEASIHPNGAITGNYRFDILDKLLNEPERLSIDDPIMEDAFNLVSHSFVMMPVGKIFSISELKNECTLIKSYFTYFNHNDLVFSLLVEAVEKKIFRLVVTTILLLYRKENLMSSVCLLAKPKEM